MNGIAVILPVYNGEKLLEECVKSIHSAGTRITEIIIIDDGSMDGTLSIAQNCARYDPRMLNLCFANFTFLTFDSIQSIIR